MCGKRAAKQQHTTASIHSTHGSLNNMPTHCASATGLMAMRWLNASAIDLMVFGDRMIRKLSMDYIFIVDVIVDDPRCISQNVRRDYSKLHDRTYHVIVCGADATAGDDEVEEMGLAPHLVADFLEVVVDDCHALQAHAHLEWWRNVLKQFMRAHVRFIPRFIPR